MPTTTYWSPTAPSVAQVDTLTVGGTPAAGNTVTATVGVTPNTVAISYLVVGGDTTSTIATALQALLTASSGVAQDPRFLEITFSVSNNVITCTSATPGTPFTLSASATGGGATLTQATTTANVSPSDVFNAANWNRNGAQSLPQNGDDVVVANSSIPLLWNLGSLSAVLANSYTRWQSFTATLGLPVINPSGYVEYRPTDFKLGSNVTNLPVNLGLGAGSGPTRERYNFGTYQCAWNIAASGSAADTYAVHILNANASSTINVQSTSVGVATLPTQTSQITSAICNSGGTLTLGSGVTVATLTYINGQGTISCAPATLNVYNGSSLIFNATGGTVTTANIQDGSNVSWLSNTTISLMNLLRSSIFSKVGDLRGMVINHASIDATCVVNDPNSSMTWSYPVTVNGQVQSAWYLTGSGRTWLVV